MTQGQIPSTVEAVKDRQQQQLIEQTGDVTFGVYSLKFRRPKVRICGGRSRGIDRILDCHPSS